MAQADNQRKQLIHNNMDSYYITEDVDKTRRDAEADRKPSKWKQAEAGRSVTKTDGQFFSVA